MQRPSPYTGYSFWWLLAFAPAMIVALYAGAGALWEPLLVGTNGTDCINRSVPRPVDFVLGISFIGGAVAAVGGAYRALRRAPRMTGVVIMSMGLALAAAGLALYVVVVANDLDVERCRRD